MLFAPRSSQQQVRPMSDQPPKADVNSERPVLTAAKLVEPTLEESLPRRAASGRRTSTHRSRSQAHSDLTLRKSSSAQRHSCLCSLEAALSRSSQWRCIAGNKKTTQNRPGDPNIPLLRAASICSCCCTRPVGGTVNSSHANVALSPLPTPFALLLAYKRICVVTASQIELTSDSPVFAGQSLITQSSDFSPNSRKRSRALPHRSQRWPRRLRAGAIQDRQA